MEDHRIIELFFARSEQAIAALAAAYGTACVRLARNILNSDRDAEECVSDSYLAVWNTVPPARPDPLRAYLLRIVRNIAIARYHANTAAKRNSCYDVALDELEGVLSSVTVERQAENKELSRTIDRFLGGLKRDDRILFVRRYWYGDGIAELAKRFGISSHYVSVRLARTREKLKIHLKKEGYDL